MALTLPTQNCDVAPDLGTGPATSAGVAVGRPRMLSGAGLRGVVLGTVAGAAGMALALGLVTANHLGVGAGARSTSATSTTWVVPSAAGQLTSLGPNQWLLATASGGCVVTTGVDPAGALQLYPVDPSLPGCVGVASGAH